MTTAAFGAGLELQMRLLCGIIPSIAEVSTAHRLEDVEDALASHFRDSLSGDDRSNLQLCRQLRNKILHADFHSARRKLTAIDGDTSSAHVRMGKLDEGREVEHLKEIARDGGLAGISIANTRSTAEGTVFGWLLEFGLSGEFLRAAAAFRKGTAIIERLRSETED
jgi:hypothetical protein